MKKTKILLLLLLITIIASSTLKAQEKEPYIPIAREGAQWLIYSDYPETPYIDILYGYRIEGDTIINDTTYKKVYIRGFESIDNSYVPPYLITIEYLYAGIRDDVESRKVYGRRFHTGGYCPTDKDFLLYDFSIELGSTNTGSMCISPYDEYTVDDIYYGYAYEIYYTKAIRLLTNNYCYSYMFEGIGSDHGLFEPFYCFEATAYLEQFCIGTDEECLDWFLAPVEENKRQENIISVFPNPATDILSVNLKVQDYANDYFLEITNIIGKQVLIQPLTIDNNEVNISELENGIYIINLYQNNTLKQTKKLIKQ